MNFRIPLAISLGLLLTACKTDGEVQIVYKTTNVPVYVVPAPPPVNRPELALETTPKEVLDSSDGAYVKALAASFEQLSGYVEELEIVVNKYKELAAISAQNVLPENMRNVNTIKAEDLKPKTTEEANTDENPKP